MKLNRRCHSSRRLSLAIAGVATVGLVLAGCGSSSSSHSGPISSSSGSVSTSESSTLPNIAGLNLGETQQTSLGADFPLKSKPPAGKKVCFVENGNPYGALWYAGMPKAASALGWTLKTITANQQQPSTYATAITSSIQAGCNAVIQPAANLQFWQSAIPQARKAGMVIEDAQTSDTQAASIPGVIRASKAEDYQFYIGVLGAMGVLRDIHQHFPSGHAKIMLLNVPQFASVLAPVNKGYEEAIKEGCPSCTIWVDTVDVSVVLGPGANPAFVQALRTHPGTNYMEISGEQFGGLAAAIASAGISPVPKLTGFEPLPSGITDLESAHPHALGWVAAANAPIGAEMLDALARYWTHTTPIDPWDDANGNPPSLVPKVQPPMEWLTSANVHQFVSEGENFPKDWLTELEKMWHVS